MRKLAALVCIFFCIGNVQAQECVIKVGVDELKPHLSPDLDGGGPLAQNFSKAMAEIGCDTEFHWLPWARAFAMTKQGKLTVTFPWGDSPQRRKDFIASKPAWNSKLYLYHFKDTQVALNSVKDLSKYNVAGLKGYSYLPNQQDKTLNIIKVPSENALVNVLLKKRVDGILIWEVLMSNYPELANNPEITHHRFALNTKAGLALFSRKDPNSKKYADIFDAQFVEYLENNLE